MIKSGRFTAQYFEVIVLKKLKFPWLYILELLLWFPLIAGFIVTIGFLEAKPIASLALQGKTLPRHWEAAVASHGKYIEWYLIANHPMAFTGGLLLLVLSVIALYRVHRAQLWQQKNVLGEHSRLHKIARFCVMATLAILGYIFLTQYLVGISPI